MGHEMTSQVAISNFYGVAVASDTVSSRQTGGGLKTVTHTNKIYELGPGHEVLVLHSGSSVTNGVPAWLLVTQWAKTLRGPLETVQDYIDSFLRWADEASPLHSKDSENEILGWRINSHLSQIAQSTRSAIGKLQDQNPDTSESIDSRAVLATTLRSNMDWLKSQPTLENLTSENAAELFANYPKKKLDDMVQYWLSQFNVDKKDNALIKESITYALSSAFYLSDDDSSLAFVGFGSTQAFPFNRVLQCRAFYSGKLRYVLKEPRDYAPKESLDSGIDFFAQSYAIEGFLRGYRNQTLNQIGNYIDQALVNEVTPPVDEAIRDKVVAQVLDKARDFAQNTYVEPLFGEVQGMNASRLAEFAESLVGLQAIAAKGEDGPATVGGLIEVATIDKGTGIRWVKCLDQRKIQ